MLMAMMRGRYREVMKSKTKYSRVKKIKKVDKINESDVNSNDSAGRLEGQDEYNGDAMSVSANKVSVKNDINLAS